MNADLRLSPSHKIWLTTFILLPKIAIGNIHIRYEDTVARPEHPFAMGLTLRDVMAETTDDHWQPAFISGMPIKVHKLAGIDSLSVYWDPVRKRTKENEIANVGSANFRATLPFSLRTPRCCTNCRVHKWLPVRAS